MGIEVPLGSNRSITLNRRASARAAGGVKYWCEPYSIPWLKCLSTRAVVSDSRYQRRTVLLRSRQPTNQLPDGVMARAAQLSRAALNASGLLAGIGVLDAITLIFKGRIVSAHARLPAIVFALVLVCRHVTTDASTAGRG